MANEAKPEKTTKTSASSTTEPVFHVLLKRDDGEEIAPMTEAQIMKLEDATIAELFMDEKEAIARKGALAFARVQRVAQKTKARAKVARQRKEFAEKHPEIAAKQRLSEKMSLKKHLETLLEAKAISDVEAKKIEARIAELEEAA